MGEVNSTLVGDNIEVMLNGLLPIQFGDTIQYNVICYDLAGNNVTSSTYSISSIDDKVAPEFIYSRVVGAYPGVNATLVANFYEPDIASGMNYVEVHISMQGETLNAFYMTYNEETGTWVFSLPKLYTSDTIEYYFVAEDNNGNTYQSPHNIEYTLLIENPIMTIEGEAVNVIEGANMAGHFRCIFSVETEGFYSFMPIFSNGVANFTMWLDGQLIPNGAQVMIGTNVHVLMIRIETGDEFTAWGVRLMSSKVEELRPDGQLPMNVLIPALSNDELAIEDSWARGLMTTQEYFGHYDYHNRDAIDGDFETDFGEWDTDDMFRIEPGYDSSYSVRFCDVGGNLGYMSYDYPDGNWMTGISFFYYRNGDGEYSDLLVAIKTKTGDWYNTTLRIEDVSDWTEELISFPYSEVDIVYLEQVDFDPGTSASGQYQLRVDDIKIRKYIVTYGSWNIDLQTDISPHALLGLSGGIVSVDFASYVEFIAEETKDAQLQLDFGSGSTGLTVDIYHEGSWIYSVTSTDVTLPFKMVKGINKIALYIQANSTEDGYLKTYIKDQGVAEPITVLGQACGLT